LDESYVEFAHKDLFPLQCDFVRGHLDDFPNNVIFDSFALFYWKDLPSGCYRVEKEIDFSILFVRNSKLKGSIPFSPPQQ